MEDELVFGKEQLVYCRQHLRPHSTGWCSVSVSEKVGLGTNDINEAYEKCRRLELYLYEDHIVNGKFVG